MRAFKIALCLASCSLAMQVVAADTLVAGTASIVAGSVSAAAADGTLRSLQKDDAVYSGDRILTGAASYARIGLLDGGSMVLRPHTEFAIERFRFQPGQVESTVNVVPAPASGVGTPALQIGNQGSVGNQAFFRLVRGGFRAVSGLVGKINREEYAVRTPVATIGIRGTVFSVVSCDAMCAADSVVQGSLPAGESALGGTVSVVDQGSISLVSTTGATAVMQPAQFVLTTASGVHVSLPALPGFLIAESWLSAAQQAAVAPPAPAPVSVVASSTLSTVPTLGSLAAVILIGAAALSTDMQADPDTSGSPPAGGSGTATSTAR